MWGTVNKLTTECTRRLTGPQWLGERRTVSSASRRQVSWAPKLGGLLFLKDLDVLAAIYLHVLKARRPLR